MLFLALLGGFPLDAIRYGYGLFHRLASVYFSLNVLAERGFACRFTQRHGYFFLPIGVGLYAVVVRITAFCILAGLLGLAGNLIGLRGGVSLVIRRTNGFASGRPPDLLVVPSRAMIFSAAALRLASAPGPIPRSAFVARLPYLSVGRVEIPSRIIGFLAGILRTHP